MVILQAYISFGPSAKLGSVPGVHHCLRVELHGVDLPNHMHLEAVPLPYRMSRRVARGHEIVDRPGLKYGNLIARIRWIADLYNLHLEALRLCRIRVVSRMGKTQEYARVVVLGRGHPVEPED